MKKAIKTAIATIVLVSVLGLSACGNSKSNPETKSLYAQGLEVVQLMNEMIQSDEYINAIATDSLKPTIQELADGNYSKPKAVYSIYASDKEIAKLVEFKEFDNISDNLKSFVSSKFCNSLINLINSRGGAEDVAVAGICSAGKTFVNENVGENIIYLYTYDDAVPIAVTFITGDDNSVSANGVFVMYDEFTCNSADEIKEFFNYITVEVTEIRPES
ncbi:MAG: hypothetical protein K2J32_06970 [Ruminococcus sp.]|nr:hypothetical protein [Ruminococcus sp.]